MGRHLDFSGKLSGAIGESRPADGWIPITGDNGGSEGSRGGFGSIRELKV